MDRSKELLSAPSAANFTELAQILSDQRSLCLDGDISTQLRKLLIQNSDGSDACKKLLHQMTVVAFGALMASEANAAPKLVKLLTREGLVGWTDHKEPFIFCQLDKNCAQAAVQRAEALSAHLESLATAGDAGTAEDSVFLLRQLFLATGHIAFNKSLLKVISYMISVLEAQQTDESQPDVIYLLVRGIAFHYPRYEAWDQIWLSSGVVNKILSLMEDKEGSVPKKYKRSALKCIFSLSRVAQFKVHLRDQSLLPIIVRMYDVESKGLKHEWDEDISKILFNLSENETLLNSMREGAQGSNREVQTASNGKQRPKSEVERLQITIVQNHPSEDAAARLFALMCLANMYGVENNDDPVQELLSEQDTSKFLHSQLSEALDKGTASIKAAGFTVYHSLSTVVGAIQSVSANADAAQAMAKEGIIHLLVKVIERKVDPEKVQPPAENGGQDPTEQIAKAARALLNFSFVKSLRQSMIDIGVVTAIESLAASKDLRIADAAAGVLRNLEGKGDDAMEQVSASIHDAKAAKFDVFLSHKRTDAKDFARALYNLLDVRGIRSFLDFEYREELSKLDEIVGQCTNFLFILTDNVFDSPWCLIELEAAVKSKVNIILLVKDGARWPDDSGNLVCNFPTYTLIQKLPEGCRPAFDSKALTHSDEYYQAFVDHLIPRIKLTRPTLAPTTNSPSQPDAILHSEPGAMGALPATSSAELGSVRRELSAEISSLGVRLSEQIQASERSLQSRLSDQSQLIQTMIQGFAFLQTSILSQLSSNALEMSQMRQGINNEVLLIQGMRQSQVQSEATIKEEVSIMRASVSSALSQMATSVGAYGRAVMSADPSPSTPQSSHHQLSPSARGASLPLLSVTRPGSVAGARRG